MRRHDEQVRKDEQPPEGEAHRRHHEGQDRATTPALPEPPADEDVDARDCDEEPRERPAKRRQSVGPDLRVRAAQEPPAEGGHRQLTPLSVVQEDGQRGDGPADARHGVDHREDPMHLSHRLRLRIRRATRRCGSRATGVAAPDPAESRGPRPAAQSEAGPTGSAAASQQPQPRTRLLASSSRARVSVSQA